MSAERKDEHLRLAVEHQEGTAARNDFDAVRFVHHALAGLDADDVDTSTTVAGLPLTTPFYLNGMTGGSRRSGEVNRDLAIAARETGLAIASGSLGAYFADPERAESYRVIRRMHPEGVVMANVSADARLEQARAAVELLDADALQIHVNALQETVMPEGDRSFGAWPERIAAIVEGIGVPVIVKEVGFGLSARTVHELRALGVRVADVSGRGGTDFARIENERREGRDFGYLQGWGQSAPEALLDAAGIEGIELLASGGVRTPLDVVRALALGARAVGVSGRFLGVLMEGGPDALIRLIREWQEQLSPLMVVLGARTPVELSGCELLITGALREFCELRGIDAGAYARRGARGDDSPPSTGPRATNKEANEGAR